MTACAKWKDSLLDSALGMPAPHEQAEHLKTCAACADALSGLRARRAQMDAALPKLTQGAGPRPGFSARLIASLEVSPARRVGWLAPARVFAGIAAVVVLAAILASPLQKWMAGSKLNEAPASALSEWRSPTETLLRSPGDVFLRSNPQLGEFYFAVKPHDQRADTDGRKRRNP